MSTSIETYDRKHLEGMCELYNAETAFEPHIAPLNADRFLSMVESKSYFDPDGLLVAVDAGKVIGWIHACVAPGSEGHHDPTRPVPRIRMLIYPRDRIDVGKLLVSEATAWLEKAEADEIEALHAKVGYPFYRGLWCGGEPMGPSTMPHVQLALEVGGYKNAQESIFMVAAMPMPPKEIAPSAKVEFVESPAEMRHEAMRESWVGFEPMTTSALIDGQHAGGISWVVQPHLDRLGAPCINIWGLGVAEQHRRKGIATALIARSMIRAHAMGARFASVGTQLWNAPAHASYAKLGYRPHCVLVGRLRVREPKTE